MPVQYAAYGIGLGATLVAAALLSVTRMEHRYVPQEAIIGIVYVVASAATILLAAQAPRGSEHVEQLLTGSLLWVTWREITKTALIYGLIGLVHWSLRDRFFTISLRPEEARGKRWAIAWWDFLFYALFGVVVTSSVAIAGVLLVFSFLVIPAVIAFLFTDSPGRLLTTAWATGTAASVLGLYVSYVTDLPTGPVVVCSFALALVLAFAVRAVAGRRLPAVRPQVAGPAAGGSRSRGSTE
jgi:zinc/manganese transport system permease protein